MNGKTKLFLLFSVFLITMCTSRVDEPITYENGLSCQNYANTRFFEWRGEEYNFYLREEGANCTYTCPNGTLQEAAITGTSSPLYSSSKEELDVELCGIAAGAAPTAQESLLTAFPVSTESPTPVASRTPRVSPTAVSTSVASASPTGSGLAVVTLPAQGALLTGTVSMCDLGGKLINFRITQPPQEITGRALEVQIGGQKSNCYVNPTNRSLLTCSIPIGVSFPARVLVTLDGRVVNDFEYNGLGCAVITTPTPAPRSYP
jgi:hypothetical protein